MDYTLQNAAPQPTLQHIVRDIDGKRVRVIVFSGVVAIAPAQQHTASSCAPRLNNRRADRVLRTGGVRRPLEGAIAVAEANLQVVVDGRTQMATAWDQQHRGPSGRSGQTGHGMAVSQLHMPLNDLALGVHYRVTVSIRRCPSRTSRARTSPARP
jgi:hypothetical protein